MVNLSFSPFFLLDKDDERIYAYVRFETGDEMSRRAKFAFITWIGPSVSVLRKAKVSTDKAFVKAVWPVSSPTKAETRVSSAGSPGACIIPKVLVLLISDCQLY